MTTPRHNDVARLDNIIRRLFRARDTLPSVRDTIEDYINDALDAQGSGKGSGVSDPTGARAGRIAPIQQRHRWLSEALQGVERAVEHLAVTAERCLSEPRPPGYDGPEASTSHTCPVMVLRRSATPTETRRPDGSSRSEVLVRCGAITAHKLDEHGNPIGYDPDGYCLDHRAEADEATRRAIAETHAERLAADAHRKRLARR